MKLFTVGAFVVALIGLALAFRATTARSVAPAAASGSGMQAIGSVKDIMIAITIPTSTDVFNAAAEPPKDDAGWDKARLQALALAESANLLLMPEHAASKTDWNTLAIAQRDAAVVAMKAAQKKDADALSNASDALYETCDNCHKKFMLNK
jgi:hypothetical protein